MTAGEPVNLTIINRGRVLHDVTVDEFDLRIEMDRGQDNTAGLSVHKLGRLRLLLQRVLPCRDRHA